MDDNVNSVPQQNTQQPATNPPSGTLQGSFVPPQPPPAAAQSQPPVQNPFMPQNLPIAESSVQQQAPTEQPTAEAAPRITLEDLYGPSNLQETQPVQPVVPLPEPIQSVDVAGQPQNISQEQASLPPVQQTVQESVPQPPQPLPSEPIFPQQEAAVPQVNAPLPVETVNQDEPVDGGGKFHLPSILRFVVGGIIVLLVILLVWGAGSLLFQKKSTGNGNVTLTYWGLWEDQNVMQSVLSDFEKQHPNITVSYVREDPKDYVRRLLQRTNDGTGPDIFRIHNTWVFPLQNTLLPLSSDVISNKDLESNYPPTVAKDLRVNGALYALPLQMDALSLFVNTDIFTHAGAKVPTTWNDFITVAKALTVKDPSGHIQTSGAAIGSYDNIAHAPDVVSMLFLQNGANVQKLNNSQNATDALSFYTSFAKSDGNIWDTTLDNSLLAFSNGKAAMYFGYSYDIFAIKATNPNLHFAIYPVPHLPGRDITIASYWTEAISNKSKHQKEALQLMQYLAQKDTQTKLYTEEAKIRQFGELYARTDLTQSLLSDPLLAPIVGQFKTAQSSIFSADTDYDEYNGALNQYLGNAINSILKGTSEDSAAATLSQGVSQVVSQFGPKTP